MTNIDVRTHTQQSVSTHPAQQHLARSVDQLGKPSHTSAKRGLDDEPGDPQNLSVHATQSHISTMWRNTLRGNKALQMKAQRTPNASGIDTQAAAKFAEPESRPSKDSWLAVHKPCAAQLETAVRRREGNTAFTICSQAPSQHRRNLRRRFWG